MGLLTFSINVTLDGCVDHREGIADDEIHAFFTRLMDEGGAMLWGRVTYELMEGESSEVLIKVNDRVYTLEQISAEVLPKDYNVDYAGQSRQYKTEGSALVVTFFFALVIIYLVLAAQFESFVDPFVIMLTVPLSMTGALLALKLSGGTLNVYSKIGLVTDRKSTRLNSSHRT